MNEEKKGNRYFDEYNEPKIIPIVRDVIIAFFVIGMKE